MLNRTFTYRLGMTCHTWLTLGATFHAYLSLGATSNTLPEVRVCQVVRYCLTRIFGRARSLSPSFDGISKTV